METHERNSPPPFKATIPKAADATSPASVITVLVVDDEPLMIMVVCAMLLTLGYRAITATNGEEALRIAKTPGGSRIHILLTDYWMAGMLGDELARRFHEACPAAGIIMMSGNLHEPPSVPRCEFLAKPFHAEALREKLHAALPSDTVN